MCVGLYRAVSQKGQGKVMKSEIYSSKFVYTCMCVCKCVSTCVYIYMYVYVFIDVLFVNIILLAHQITRKLLEML
jgi:hypothetical protein